MSSPKPPPPNEVPETDATYERSNEDPTLKRADAKSPSPLPSGGKIAGSMKTEEPDGWDQAPMDIKDPRAKRHPRPDGVGGSDPASAKRDPQR